MSYDMYESCPHCWTDVDGYEDSIGCDLCNHTGKRILDMEAINLFASAKSHFDSVVEASFSAWQKHINRNETKYGVESFEISGNTIFIQGTRYTGCNEYDHKSFQMPTKYIVGEAPIEMIKEESNAIDERLAAEAAVKTEENRLKKLKDDAQKALITEQRDREEFERLSKKFSAPDGGNSQ